MAATLFDPPPLAVDRSGVAWSLATAGEADELLTRHHYLGPINTGKTEIILVGRMLGEVVAAQVWRRPTSRHLPADGTWLELVRWCLTPPAGLNAGSRQHRSAVAAIRRIFPAVTTLVSYSDPAQGHTGSLYRACNWRWSPTWQRLRPPPTGGGNWGGAARQEVKDRWVFCIRRDARRRDLLRIDDPGAIRFWLAQSPDYAALRRAFGSPAVDLSVAASKALYGRGAA